MSNLSDLENPPCIGEIDKIIGKSILKLKRVSRAAVEILTGLPRTPVDSGTICVASDEKEKKITIMYNPLFIRLIYYIDPHLVEFVLLHELAHILLLHFILLKKNSKIMERLLDKYTQDEIRGAVDVLANFFVYSKQRKKYSCGVPIICPVCAKATSLEEYLLEASVEASTTDVVYSDTYCSPTIPSTIPSDYLLLSDSELSTFPRFDCSACLCSYYAYSNPYLEDQKLVGLTTLLIAASSKKEVESISAICEYIKQLKSLHTEDKDLNIFESLVDKYGKVDATILYKSLYTPLDMPPSFSELNDSSNGREIEYTVKDKINRAISKEVKEAGKSSLYSPVEIGAIFREDKIKWDKYLRQAICTSVNISSSPSRLHRNRRFGFIYPGYKKKEASEIIIAIDVSMSMPDDIICKIKSNMLSLKEKIDINCTVVEFDTEVVDTYSINDLTNIRSSMGGTVLSAPIEWIIENDSPKGALVFIFTDGMGPISIKENLRPYVDKYKYNWMLIGNVTQYIDQFCGRYSKVIEVEL